MQLHVLDLLWSDRQFSLLYKLALKKLLSLKGQSPFCQEKIASVWRISLSSYYEKLFLHKGDGLIWIDIPARITIPD